MHSHIVHEAETPQRSAVVFDTPHSGIVLPDHFRYACRHEDLMHLHDPHIEKLLADIPATGAPVLEAMIHRTCIDLNRFHDEINPEIITGQWPHPVRRTKHTDKKLGLFPVFAGPRSQRNREIYSAATPLTPGEAQRRIADYHAPYYASLKNLMNTASRLHGHALHVDVHSFYRRPEHKNVLTDIILGDMNGTTCSPCISSTASTYLKTHGLSVSFNGPDFSGGALIQTTTDMENLHHSLQVEIARDLYMDPDTLELDEAKSRRIKDALTGLSKRLILLMK